MLSFSDASASASAKRSTPTVRRVLRQRKESPSVSSAQSKTVPLSASKASKSSRASIKEERDDDTEEEEPQQSKNKKKDKKKKKSTTAALGPVTKKCADCHKQFQSHTSVKKHRNYCPVRKSKNVAAVSDTEANEDLIVTRMTSRSDRIKSASKEVEQEKVTRARTRSSSPLKVESSAKTKRNTKATALLDRRHNATESAGKAAAAERKNNNKKKQSKAPSKDERKRHLNGNDFINERRSCYFIGNKLKSIRKDQVVLSFQFSHFPLLLLLLLFFLINPI